MRKGSAMQVDYIIPIYKLDKHREKNLENTVRWLEGQKYCDVNIIIEKQEDGIFNKPWLCNRGVRKAKTDHIFIGDVDIYSTNLLLFWYLDEVLMKTYRWGFPWRRVKYLDEAGGVKRWWYPYPYGNEGCIVYFKKEMWEKIGGFNEFFWELRGPDNEITLRLYYETGYYMTEPNTLIHQYHPISPMKKTNYLKQNQGILKYTAKNPERVNKLLRHFEWGGEKPYSEGLSFFEARKMYGL